MPAWGFPFSGLNFLAACGGYPERIGSADQLAALGRLGAGASRLPGNKRPLLPVTVPQRYSRRVASGHVHVGACCRIRYDPVKSHYQRKRHPPPKRVGGKRPTQAGLSAWPAQTHQRPSTPLLRAQPPLAPRPHPTHPNSPLDFPIESPFGFAPRVFFCGAPSPGWTMRVLGAHPKVRLLRMTLLAPWWRGRNSSHGFPRVVSDGRQGQNVLVGAVREPVPDHGHSTAHSAANGFPGNSLTAPPAIGCAKSCRRP